MTSKVPTRLKNMVLQFRVAELQTFLEAFGEQNLKLRKKTLQNRALALLNQKRTKAVFKKIISLHKNMSSSRRSNDTPYHLRDSNKLYPKRYYSSDDDSPLYDDDFYAADKYRDAQFSNYEENGPLDLSENSSYLSKLKLLNPEGIKNIKFPDLPFFEHVSDIMLVTPMVPISEIDALFEFKASFSINSEVYRYLFGCNDQNKKYEVMLRLCLFNEKLEIEDLLPQKLYLSINNRYCSCIPDNYSSKNDSSGKRPGMPMNITPYIDKSTIMYQIVIHWSVSYQLMFAATVQLVKKRGTDELIKNLVEKGEQDPSVSKKLIYDNLNEEDNEIAATSLKMSLICPLGKMIMMYPARGTTCNHLQCFDGALYIKMNEIKSTWQCPVCNQPCLYQNLFIDGYFMNILRSEKFSPDIRDIQLSADGSWESVVSETKKRLKTSSPIKVPEKRTRNEEESDKILPDASSSLLQGNFVDDLKEIFTSFINCSETRSHYPEFSIYDSVFEPPNSGHANFPTNVQPILTNRRVPETLPVQKKIIVVDLTTDSETDDDIKSTSSSSSNCSMDFFADHIKNKAVSSLNRNILNPNPFKHFSNPPSPPVFDIIDSD